MKKWRAKEEKEKPHSLLAVKAESARSGRLNHGRGPD